MPHCRKLASYRRRNVRAGRHLDGGLNRSSRHGAGRDDPASARWLVSSSASLSMANKVGRGAAAARHSTAEGGARRISRYVDMAERTHPLMLESSVCNECIGGARGRDAVLLPACRFVNEVFSCYSRRARFRSDCREARRRMRISPVRSRRTNSRPAVIGYHCFPPREAAHYACSIRARRRCSS
jgi:hypothetical protein